MKRSIIYPTTICSILAAILLFTACKDRLDLTNPSFQTPESYFENSKQLKQVTNSIYALFASPSIMGREWYFIHDLRSDEVASGGSQLEVPRYQIISGITVPSNSYMFEYWSGLYALIHRANSVITKASNVEEDPALVKRLVGEAKFFRAWAYNELVTFWGGIPLYTKPVDDPSNFKPRAPKDSVYKQIVQDLKDAASVLPATYNKANTGRVTSGAANALLARVYMQRLNFSAAKTALQKVMNSPANYQLVDNYYANFKIETEFNKGSIFEAVFIDKSNSFDWGYTREGAGAALTTLRTQSYCPIAWRNLIPSDKYLANFELEANGAPKTDPRLDISVYFAGETFNDGQNTMTADMMDGNASTFEGETIKTGWRKYQLLYKLSPEERPSLNPSGLNSRVIRYAEILLNMAECIIETNPSNISGALQYINMVRDRVNMPHYPTPQYPAENKLDVIKIIMHERMAELGAEHVRNMDIKRWIDGEYYEKFGGDPLAIGGPSGENPFEAAGKNYYLPIPSAEVNNNPELGSGSLPEQNPGY